MPSTPANASPAQIALIYFGALIVGSVAVVFAAKHFTKPQPPEVHDRIVYVCNCGCKPRCRCCTCADRITEETKPRRCSVICRVAHPGEVGTCADADCPCGCQGDE